MVWRSWIMRVFWDASYGYMWPRWSGMDFFLSVGPSDEPQSLLVSGEMGWWWQLCWVGLRHTSTFSEIIGSSMQEVVGFGLGIGEALVKIRCWSGKILDLFWETTLVEDLHPHLFCVIYFRCNANASLLTLVDQHPIGITSILYIYIIFLMQLFCLN